MPLGRACWPIHVHGSDTIPWYRGHCYCNLFLGSRRFAIAPGATAFWPASGWSASGRLSSRLLGSAPPGVAPVVTAPLAPAPPPAASVGGGNMRSDGSLFVLLDTFACTAWARSIPHTSASLCTSTPSRSSERDGDDCPSSSYNTGEAEHDTLKETRGRDITATLGPPSHCPQCSCMLIRTVRRHRISLISSAKRFFAIGSQPLTNVRKCRT